MRAVVFFSASGESRRIAEYLSKRLDLPLMETEKVNTPHFEELVLVFPVYCQNLPVPVSRFLGSVSAKRLTAIATYGKMGFGNVLYEIQSRYPMDVIAAAYIPTKHTYIQNDTPFEDFGALDPIIEKLSAPSPSSVSLPRLGKDPFADLFPSLRSRLGISIRKTESCDGCGICASVCPMGSMRSGRTGSDCIRCLRCVNSCPSSALKSKARLPLRLYLSKTKETRTVIYV